MLSSTTHPGYNPNALIKKDPGIDTFRDKPYN
jgi:hypothetical protein